MDEDQIFHEYGSPDDVRGVVDSYLRLHGGIAKDIPSHRWKDSNFVDGQSVGTRSLTEAALIDPSVRYPFCLITNSYFNPLRSVLTIRTLDRSSSPDKLIMLGTWYVPMLLGCQTLI